MNPVITTTDKLKIGMAIAMLLCLLDMPYGYYQVVRLGSAIGFGYLATTVRDEEDVLRWVYIGLAILFQPIIKIALGRTIWNIMDLIVAVWLIYSVLKSKNLSNP